jgi:hypothetical protein
MSKAIEEQAAGRIRRISYGFEQTVIKLMFMGAWDEERYGKFKKKAVRRLFTPRQKNPSLSNENWAKRIELSFSDIVGT